jgi:hypothetical protein
MEARRNLEPSTAPRSSLVVTEVGQRRALAAAACGSEVMRGRANTIRLGLQLSLAYIRRLSHGLLGWLFDGP